MRKTSGAPRSRRGGWQRRRVGPAKGREGGGVKVKAEQGEVVVPEDGDGDGDEDGDGGELHMPPPPPNPLLYTFPSGCKRPSGKTQRFAARQALPLGLPNFLNRAVGQTNQFFVTPARVTTPCAGSCANVFTT